MKIDAQNWCSMTLNLIKYLLLMKDPLYVYSLSLTYFIFVLHLPHKLLSIVFIPHSWKEEVISVWRRSV